MWLLTPVYERIPQLWFLVGALFISGGLYLGLGETISSAYIAIGFGCCVFGAGVMILRLRHRNSQSVDNDPTT